eukprot:COSAG02_NODE_3132_length_7308_cov_6.430157_3_plen_127_part_00
MCSGHCLALTHARALTAGGGGRDADVLEAQVAAATGVLLVIYVILAILITFFPCIVFLCAYQQCISQHKIRGETPTCCAWTTCIIIFCLTVFTMLGVGITWLILPFFMIIPFCMGMLMPTLAKGLK